MDIFFSFDSMRTKLSNMLVSYFKAEDINCEYKCDACKKKTSITKYTEICVLPPVIVLHLKRFDSGYGKHNGSVDIKEILDIRPYLSEDYDSNISDKKEKSTKYELIAVSEHIGGSIDSGHYVAFSKREDKWYECNDSSIGHTVSDEAMSKSAYMLFYKRIV